MPAGAARPRSRYGRRRAATLATVYGLIGLHVAHWRYAGRTLAPLELNEVLYTLHDGIVTAGFLFMAVAVLATALVGRFFCSWGCHMLALEDLCAWLLAKAGLRPKPVRSRALAWIPALTVAALVVGPLVERLLGGAPAPALRVVSDPRGWTSFVTEDLWRNLPGPWMAALTLVVCGFVIVYLLGSRSFCRYVCPYGAVFAAADRVAPGRIVAIGDCSRCGICTAVCQSHVRVHEEVARFATVVSPQCLKDLDCVSACPRQVLRFGFTRPPALRPGGARTAPRRAYEFSTGEEVVIAATFVATFVIYRGLYEAVGLLLALALAVIAAHVAVVVVRLARSERLRAYGVQLKVARRLTAGGVVFVVIAVAAAALTTHAAVVRWHVVLGARALASRDVVRARAHLETVARWGWVRPAGLRRELAMLARLAGEPAAAERELRALLAIAPHDDLARLGLGRLLLDGGRSAEAAAELAIVADRPHPRGRRDFLVRAEAAALLGRLLVAGGRLEEAAARLADAAELQPDSAAAHNDLAVVLTRLERHAEAVEHYRAALAARPDDPRIHQNLGTVLYHRGELDAAAAAWRRTLALEPDDAAAHVGLAMVLRRRGDLGAARRHWQRAREIDGAYADGELP